MATIVNADGTRMSRDKAETAGFAPGHADLWTEDWVQAAEVHVRVPLEDGEGAKVDTAALAELVGAHLAEAGISGADQAEAYLVARLA